MALIENLEQDNWQAFLRQSFDSALELLGHDRFRWAGSSIDDLKSWLTAGGVSRVKTRLNDQMEMRQFSTARKMAVNEVLEELVRNNRLKLLGLMANGIIAPDPTECLTACGFSTEQFKDLWSRLLVGENPFELWMREQGRSEAEIKAVYQVIDEWLIDSEQLKLSTNPHLN